MSTPASPPPDLEALQVALSLDTPDGPRVAAWRDDYLARAEAVAAADAPSADAWTAMVNLCVDDLHARQLCYSCGRPADHLVWEDFPWACRTCDPD